MKSEDQVAEAKAKEQSEEKRLSLDESFDKGWEQVELATAQEVSAKAKPADKGDGKPDDKKKEEDSTSKPFKILKVQGKEIPVMTEAEYDALASKGADYTKKTQALADDRRDAEAKVKTETDRLATEAARMNDFMDQLVKWGYLPKKVGEAKKAAAVAAGNDAEVTDTVDDEDLSIYKEFQMDPSQALPHEKNIVKTIVELRKTVEEMRLKEATEIVEQAIAEERENFPFEDIKDDQGQNLTQKTIKAMLLTKRQMSGIERPDIDQIIEWSRETVRELHEKTKKVEVATDSVITDDMDPAEFAKKYPKLAEKFKITGAEEVQAEKAKLPPTIKPMAKPVDGSKKPMRVAREGKSLDDFLNEGFSDPDIIKALNPGG